MNTGMYAGVCIAKRACKEKTNEKMFIKFRKALVRGSVKRDEQIENAPGIW